MGIIQLPCLDMYWQTTNPLITTNGISNIMSRIWFQQVFQYLHLADNAHQIPADQPGHDKLYKVRNLLSRQFQSDYTPIEYVTIDEAVIPFKGRLGFKQYVKDKPTKSGSRCLSWVMQQMVMCTDYKYIQEKTLNLVVPMLFCHPEFVSNWCQDYLKDSSYSQTITTPVPVCIKHCTKKDSTAVELFELIEKSFHQTWLLQKLES